MAMINLPAVEKLCEKYPWIEAFHLYIIQESQDVLVKAKTKCQMNIAMIPVKISDCKIALQKLKDERNKDTYEEAVYKQELDTIEKEFERLIEELEDVAETEIEDKATKIRKCILQCKELENEIKEKKLRLNKE